ncbi:MAG: hypothetical protein U5Q03_13170 [Bacteroidota bacterium]|nr:hypothetical protein [Bacteroidota bacterium]
MKRSNIRAGKGIILTSFLLLFITACMTYYEKTQKFQDYIQMGEMDKAEKLLADDKKAAEGKNRFLYFVNNGWINWITDQHQQSNAHFQDADIYIEDYHKQAGMEALSLITNPSVKPYQPEDFEKVFVNYFKALNYLVLGKHDDALVECRRINIKLNELNDQYKDHKNRYQNDAFAHLVMGLIYESGKDWNNAFIAYRNAYDVYKKSYAENFNVDAPQQLKMDILRTAYLTGFNDEVRYYEKEFGIDYQYEQHDGGTLVFLWQNGFGPVKSEWSINFTKVDGKGGWITFVNDEMGLSFPFFIGDKPDEEKSAFASLSFLRVAFPKYLEREPLYQNGKLIINNNKGIELELAENVNAIAFKTLQDRMIREMANSLLRLATKKALEKITRDQNQDIGAALGIVNALTEKADTRNWQTLPFEVFYQKVYLPEGQHNVELQLSGHREARSHSFTFDIQKGKTAFFTFQSIESLPPAERR